MNSVEHRSERSSLKKWGLFLLAALLILCVAFGLFDFRISKSQATFNSTIASSHQGESAISIEFAPATTGLFVDAGAGLSQEIQTKLTKMLEDQDYTGQVSAMSAPADHMDIPVLYVVVAPIKHIWTPFYTSSEIQMSVSYATNGDISFRNQSITHFQSNGNQPALQYQATFTITDSAFGLISYPGYQHSLAEMLTGQVVTSHQKLISDWLSSP